MLALGAYGETAGIGMVEGPNLAEVEEGLE